MLRGLAKELVAARKPITPLQFSNLLKDANTPRIVPIDGTWLLNPAAQANGKTGSELYAAERIPGARFFDIEKAKDPNSPYPHMMPDKQTFDSVMSQLGVESGDLLVVYDAIGNFSAPRVYWMLRAFQHSNSLLLDNYPLYKNEGWPVETGEPVKPTPTHYESPGMDNDSIVLYDELKSIVVDGNSKYNMIDARPAERFEGTVAEPRPGYASGHVPGSKNVPFGLMLNADKTFKSAEELAEIFKTKLDPTKEGIITMCGSGVTACVLESALNQITDQKVRIYDGSWGEWGKRADPDTMVIKGKEF